MQSMSPLVRKLVQSARQKQFPKGQIILYPGDAVTEVLVMKSGVVKMYDIDDQGNEKVLHIVAPPAVLPFAFFAGNHRPVQWFYATLADSEVYVIPEDAFERAAIEDGQLALDLMHGFATDVHELLVRLSSLGKTKAHDKLLSTLKFLLVCHAKERANGWWRVSFMVSHQLLADITGMTRESAAMAMKEFQDASVIRSPKLNVLEIDRKKLLGL